MTDITSDAADVFRQEAAEILDSLESVLLDLERNPGERALVDAAFRAMHTLKGSGAMFGFDEVAGFVHHFETIFDLVRAGKVAANPELIGAAIEARDHIRCLVERPGTADPGQGRAILARLDAAAQAPDGSPVPPRGETSGGPAPDAPWRIRFWFKGPVLGHGTDPLRLIDEIRALGAGRVEALTDRIPPLEELDPEVCHVGWQIDLPRAVTRDQIEDVFLFVLDEMDLEFLDALPAAAPAAPAERRPEEAAAAVPAPAGAEGSGRVDVGAETVRVQAERLDDLMDRVGELVIQQARLAQLAEATGEAALKTVAEDIGRLAAGLRDTTMNIRLIPIGTLFNRYRRLIRDLSRDLGKPVDLVTEGEETELDKTMIERLADPLIHIIRNALDHGIETPQARAAAGKPGPARLMLSARHVGAEVYVTIADNGRGLDRARIRRKAEEAGLIDAATVLTDPELCRLIFEPGFSTASEISALSGRGVGMDVAKRAIEALRGAIDISSPPGEGTAVTLRLPLTLAIIDGLLIELADHRYVIPLGAVQECVELPEDGHDGRSLLDIRGDLVPFVRLREVFGASRSDTPHQKVVIVATADMQVGLVVDRIIGSHQTVIKSLSKLHMRVNLFAGATILPDGMAALILDIPQLIAGAQLRGRRPASLNLEAA